MIYFAHATETDLVKIGFTAGDPVKRLGELQTGCPYKLELLATVDGTEQDEGKWHKEFVSERVNGEWFTLTPRLMVRMIRAAVGDRSELMERVDAVENAIVLIEAYLRPLGFSLDRPKPPSAPLVRSNP